MTVGCLTVAGALLLYSRIQPGRSYVTTVLPGAVVFGLGVTALVAPLTATVLASVSAHQAGIASGVNNAVARLAGLLAVAVLPGLAGITAAQAGVGFGPASPALRMAAMLVWSRRDRLRHDPHRRAGADGLRRSTRRASTRAWPRRHRHPRSLGAAGAALSPSSTRGDPGP
jgi:hypothetical protein